MDQAPPGRNGHDVVIIRDVVSSGMLGVRLGCHVWIADTQKSPGKSRTVLASIYAMPIRKLRFFRHRPYTAFPAGYARLRGLSASTILFRSSCVAYKFSSRIPSISNAAIVAKNKVAAIVPGQVCWRSTPWSPSSRAPLAVAPVPRGSPPARFNSTLRKRAVLSASSWPSGNGTEQAGDILQKLPVAHVQLPFPHGVDRDGIRRDGLSLSPSRLTDLSCQCPVQLRRKTPADEPDCQFSHLLHGLRWCRRTESNCGPTDYKSSIHSRPSADPTRQRYRDTSQADINVSAPLGPPSAPMAL
jgi:hypothetical protein